MRDAFVRTLVREATRDPRVELVTGDLGFGVLKPYWEALPDQFTNAGIAEQNMAALAAGMAREGRRVVVYSIGNFPTLRCLEQIRNDCAYHGADVKFVCVGGGFTYGALGMSHHATEDIACMRALPGVRVLCPGDAAEAEAATRLMLAEPGTFYLRLGRGGEPRVHGAPDGLDVSRAIRVRDGAGAALLSTGALLGEVVAAADALAEGGPSPSVWSFPSVKPIDRGAVESVARAHGLVVACEEHNVVGGFGGAVAEVMAEMPGPKARLVRVGIPDEYCSEVGSQAHLRRLYGIDAAGIAARVAREQDA